jgi:hypothetical protein
MAIGTKPPVVVSIFNPVSIRNPLSIVKRLDEIGFVWVIVEPMAWEKMFAAIVEYKGVHNHCNVPQKAGEYKHLGK